MKLSSKVSIFTSVVVILVVCAVAAFSVVYHQLGVALQEVVEFKPSLTTKIYDRNGELVANVFGKENRRYAKFNEIPREMLEALVAIEDTVFFEHNGVNPDAIARAVVVALRAGRTSQGASTLTQQLVKNVVLTRERTFTRKFKEMFLALRLETMLTKEEILERYLNFVFLGHNYYGVKTAANGYFKKELDELSLKEIAMLVGMPKSPTAFDPTRNLQRSLERGNVVLTRLKTLGWISQSEFEKALAEVPVVYDESLTQNKAPYLVDAVIKEASKFYPDIKVGGYDIYTFADLKVQAMAQEALKHGYEAILNRTETQNEQIRKINEKRLAAAAKSGKNATLRPEFNATTLNGAMLVTNPLNGEVLALVGGVDYAKSSFNRVTQSIRQPGSSFKPFIYQIAIDDGYNPMTMVADISRIFEVENTGEVDANGEVATQEKFWKPRNSGGSFSGQITLNDALKYSRNLATINLLGQLGFTRAWRILKFNYGFERVSEDMSIALGSSEVGMFDYAGKFSMFAGLGKVSKTQLISQIRSNDGKILQTFTPQITQINKPEQSYLVLNMLKNAVEEGTGKRARVAGIDIAGKTGTSNKNIDTWFVGITPELQAIVWYGCDDNAPLNDREGGGVSAAPVFGEFMRSYLAQYPYVRKRFTAPSGVKRKFYYDIDALYTRHSPLPHLQSVQEGSIQDNKQIIF